MSSAARQRFETGVASDAVDPKAANRVKANLDGTYRKEISEEALEAVRRRKEEEEALQKSKSAKNRAPAAPIKPARWVPRINGTDTDEVIDIKKRIQKKEDEIQDILKRLNEFNHKLGNMTDQIVPL